MVQKSYQKLCPCGVEFTTRLRTQVYHSRECYTKIAKGKNWGKALPINIRRSEQKRDKI